VRTLGGAVSGHARGVVCLDGPFRGSEALAAGSVRKHELRSAYVALFPDVYLSVSTATLTFRQRAEAAWLWSRRGGVLSGLTAARLHGSKWVDDALPLELIWANGRPPPGITVHRDGLRHGEQAWRAGLPVTSVVRTAFDVGRQGRLSDAVARLDALGNATGVGAAEIGEFAALHRGARGVRQLARALELFDPGAQSPRETWLRMVIIGAGFPKPITQIPVVVGGRPRYYLDLGWLELKLAVEYEGDHHRTDRMQFARDIERLEELIALGWTIIRVTADTPLHTVIAKLHRAWQAASRVR
jgi:hypothetical protein